jgi:hypothetical protein
MTRETREKLNRLSKIVFGNSSRWQKIVNNGVVEPMSRDREVTVPDGRGGLKTKIFTDKKSVLKRYSVEEVASIMLDILKSRMKDGYKPDDIKPFEGLDFGTSIPTLSNLHPELALPEDGMFSSFGSDNTVTLNTDAVLTQEVLQEAIDRIANQGLRE